MADLSKIRAIDCTLTAQTKAAIILNWGEDVTLAYLTNFCGPLEMRRFGFTRHMAAELNRVIDEARAEPDPPSGGSFFAEDKQREAAARIEELEQLDLVSSEVIERLQARIKEVFLDGWSATQTGYDDPERAWEAYQNGWRPDRG